MSAGFENSCYKATDSTVGAEQAHGCPGVQLLSVLAEHSLHEETSLDFQLAQANAICSFQPRMTCDVLRALPADAGLALFLSASSPCLPIQQAEQLGTQPYGETREPG